MKISHTSATMYQECNRKYKLHYIDKLRSIEEKSSLLFGSAIDTGLNTLLKTRNVDEALNVFKTHWDKHKDNKNIKYSKADLEDHLLSEDELGSDDVQFKSWCSLREKGRIFITEYNIQVMPKIKEVIKVQIDEDVSNGSGDYLQIKADFIAVLDDDRRVIVDNKTTSVKYKDDSVKKSEQLATYFDCYKNEYKLDACMFIVIPKTTRSRKLPAVEIQMIVDTIDETMIEKTFETYQNCADGIKNGKFEPNFDSCYGKFGKCVYFDFCKKGSKTGLIQK